MKIATLPVLLVVAACSDLHSPVWSHREPPGPVSAPVVSERVVAYGHSGGVTLLELSGDKRCVHSEPSAISAKPYLDEQGLFFGTLKGDVLSLDFDCGVRWRSLAGGGMTGTFVKDEHRIYGAAHDGRIYAFDASTGEQAWVHPPAGEAPYRPFLGSVPALKDGTLYVGRRSGDILALDVENGSERYRLSSGPVTGGLRVDGVWLWAASEDGWLSRYHLESRVRELLVRMAVPVSTSPFVYGDMVFLSSSARSVVAVSRQTGEIRWRSPTIGPLHAPPVFFRGWLVVGGGSGDGRLYALDPVSGESKVRWNGRYRIAAAPTALGDTLFVTTESGQLHAFDGWSPPG